MSWDWTKEELLRELKERRDAGESDEMTHNFIWSIIQRAYDERDSATEVTPQEGQHQAFYGATEAEALVAALESAP